MQAKRVQCCTAYVVRFVLHGCRLLVWWIHTVNVEWSMGIFLISCSFLWCVVFYWSSIFPWLISLGPLSSSSLSSSSSSSSPLLLLFLVVLVEVVHVFSYCIVALIFFR